MNKTAVAITSIIVVGVLVLGGMFFYFYRPGAGQPAGSPMAGPGNYEGAPSVQPPQGFQGNGQPQQLQSNGTLFGCAELKLVGTGTVKDGIPFMLQNTDSKPHKISISIAEYSFAAGEKKTITIHGSGGYHPACDGSNVGELNVEK